MRVHIYDVARLPRRRVSVVGALGALALHLVFLSALTLGTSAGRMPKGQGDTSSDAVPSTYEGAVSALIFIDPTALAGGPGVAAPHLERQPKLQVFPTARLVRLASIDRALSGDEDNSRSSEATALTQADGAEKAMLFGRYVNQIVARIDGLWVLPRTAPSGASFWSPAPAAARDSAPGDSLRPFRCRVQILQSRDGEVREVTLLDCDGSPEWQQSLVNAIDAASPLPAPPSESVFARSVVLNFTSMGRTR